jgi:hypothetical protein
LTRARLGLRHIRLVLGGISMASKSPIVDTFFSTRFGTAFKTLLLALLQADCSFD